ncbi:DUF2274 domain-containing protein [Mesorhizobium sp.]|uniref:DUF2274 domain-containing protein n=1 Tax=Mesorhizobium sp. TaxID=1871066 RepID=UPI0025794D47|nr:DUF2274 domain-containing protein [Mesorhizobium sp.]
MTPMIERFMATDRAFAKARRNRQPQLECDTKDSPPGSRWTIKKAAPVYLTPPLFVSAGGFTPPAAPRWCAAPASGAWLRP